MVTRFSAHSVHSELRGSGGRFQAIPGGLGTRSALLPNLHSLRRAASPRGSRASVRNSSAVADGGQLLGQATTEGQQQGEEAQRNIPQRANTSRGSGQSGEPVGKRNHL